MNSIIKEAPGIVPHLRSEVSASQNATGFRCALIVEKARNIVGRILPEIGDSIGRTHSHAGEPPEARKLLKNGLHQRVFAEVGEASHGVSASDAAGRGSVLKHRLLARSEQRLEERRVFQRLNRRALLVAAVDADKITQLPKPKGAGLAVWLEILLRDIKLPARFSDRLIESGDLGLFGLFRRLFLFPRADQAANERKETYDSLL